METNPTSHPGIAPQYVGHPAQAVNDILHSALAAKQETAEKMIEVVVEQKVNAVVDESGHVNVRA